MRCRSDASARAQQRIEDDGKHTPRAPRPVLPRFDAMLMSSHSVRRCTYSPTSICYAHAAAFSPQASRSALPRCRVEAAVVDSVSSRQQCRLSHAADAPYCAALFYVCHCHALCLRRKQSVFQPPLPKAVDRGSETDAADMPAIMRGLMSALATRRLPPHRIRRPSCPPSFMPSSAIFCAKGVIPRTAASTWFA